MPSVSRNAEASVRVSSTSSGSTPGTPAGATGRVKARSVTRLIPVFSVELRVQRQAGGRSMIHGNGEVVRLIGAEIRIAAERLLVLKFS